MSEIYDATYNAVRSKMNHVDLDSVFQQHLQSMGISYDIQRSVQNIEYEMTRPSVLFKPTIYIDGNMWCTLYGSNLQDGIAGFGKTPHEAFANFDSNYCEKIKE